MSTAGFKPEAYASTKAETAETRKTLAAYNQDVNFKHLYQKYKPKDKFPTLTKQLSFDEKLDPSALRYPVAKQPKPIDFTSNSYSHNVFDPKDRKHTCHQ